MRTERSTMPDDQPSKRKSEVRRTVTSEAEVNSSASISISMRPYFSDYHVRAAAFFSEQSAELENKHGSKPPADWGSSFYDHRACVMGSILSSVAFLEAAINELFVDSVEYVAKDPQPPPTDPPRPVDQLDREGRELMAGMWPFDVDRRRILEKYQIALVLNNKPKLDTSRNPYQDTDVVVTLRNTLVHYKPQDLPAGLRPEEEPLKLARKLRGKEFALNPFMPEESGNPFFPDKALSHGCARWAFDTSLAFTDAFFSQMGITPRHAHHELYKAD